MRTFWHIAHEPKFSQIWSLHKKTEHCNVFRFRLLPRNVMTKCHEKSKNSILGPFRPLLGRTRIFLANRLLSFFFCFAKFQEKTNEQIPGKMGYRHTCVRTNMNSYELPCQESNLDEVYGVKKINFGQTVSILTHINACHSVDVYFSLSTPFFS